MVDRGAPMLLVKLQPNPGEEYRVVSDEIEGFKYTDAERKADLVELTVANVDLSHFDDPVWKKGSKIIVQWGYPGAMSPARTAVITAVKGFRPLTVEAQAESVLMNQVTRCRTFENKKVSDIAAEIAEENGFGEERRFIDDSEEIRETVTQSSVTDAQFLRMWASRLGFEFYVDFDGFHFHERRLAEAPVRVFTYHIDPGQGDVLGEPEIENDITAKPGRVRVRGRDPLERRDIDQSADNESDSERKVLTPIIDLYSPETREFVGTTGGKVRTETTVASSDTSDEAALRRARGRFRRSQQTAVKMRLPVIGDALLLAKTVVELRGLGRRLSQKYWVQEVEHDLSTGGYTCNLRLVSDGHGGHATTSTRAQGLSRFDVGSPGGRGRGSSANEVLGRLRRAVTASEESGDNRSAGIFERALGAYQARGSRARAEVDDAMRGIMRDGTATNESRQAAAEVRGILTQDGEEVPTGGQLNDKKSRVARGELEEFEDVDPETLESFTRFRATPGRGS